MNFWQKHEKENKNELKKWGVEYSSHLNQWQTLLIFSGMQDMKFSFHIQNYAYYK